MPGQHDRLAHTDQDFGVRAQGAGRHDHVRLHQRVFRPSGVSGQRREVAQRGRAFDVHRQQVRHPGGRQAVVRPATDDQMPAGADPIVQGGLLFQREPPGVHVREEDHVQRLQGIGARGEVLDRPVGLEALATTQVDPAQVYRAAGRIGDDRRQNIRRIGGQQLALLRAQDRAVVVDQLDRHLAGEGLDRNVQEDLLAGLVGEVDGRRVGGGAQAGIAFGADAQRAAHVRPVVAEGQTQGQPLIAAKAQPIPRVELDGERAIRLARRPKSGREGSDDQAQQRKQQ